VTKPKFDSGTLAGAVGLAGSTPGEVLSLVERGAVRSGRIGSELFVVLEDVEQALAGKGGGR
jgi:hypothetical protein